jgi:8-oxo-dGTP pyrophosphatase MutT (NUDIX family)
MTETPEIRKRGVVAVIVRGGRLLVIRRSETVRAPGMYCFPGGGIEAGESEETELRREMQEELHAIVEPVQPIWRYVTSWGVDLAWWLAHMPDGVKPIPNPAEVAEVQWLTPSEIEALPRLLESNLQFLEGVKRGEIIVDGLGG